MFADWLMQPIRKNQSVYLKVGLAAVMINLFGIITSLFTMTVYDRVIPNNATASLIGLSIGLLIVILFDFVLKLLRAYFVDIAGADIDGDIGDSLFSRVLALRLDQKNRSAGALSGLMRELETLRDFFASATLTALVDVPFILLTVLLMAIIGGWAVLVPIVLIFAVILVAWLIHPAMDRLSARALGEGLNKQVVLVETAGALEMVKASGAGPLLHRRWMEAVKRHSQTALRQRLVSTISTTFTASAQTLSYAGIVIVGVGMIAEGDMTMGGLIACSILSSRAMAPLGQIAGLLSRLALTRTAYRELDAIMQSPRESAENGLVPETLKGRIEFRNVTFRYPGAPERALHEVNFTIKSGEHVAFIGRVGSGKSTIARMVLGLYPPEDGLILIDGSDIRQYDLSALRSNIGVVLQENNLLNGTVRDNIVLGRATIGDDAMLRAANISGAHDFMGAIPNGYDLRLADRGEGLSGGQRQSIAIARALVARPPILVLDEPSSAMDQQSEAALIDRLEKEANKRTLILITHRPALLRLVDRIIVMEAGRVALDDKRDVVLKRLSGKKGE